MKRTPLKRGKPLRRKTPLRNRRTSTYAQRPRDLEYMAWIRTRRCAVSLMLGAIRQALGPSAVTPCFGRIEADHVGERAMNEKADDQTTIPMCEQHHLERTTFSGFFKNWTREGMREWTAGEVDFYQNLRRRT